MRTFMKLLRDESGVTAIEYGLLASIVAIGAVTVLGAVSGSLNGTFSTVANSL